MKILPAEKIVICKPAPKQKTKSGIVLPTPDKGAPEIGIVYAVGKGKRPLPLKKGDTLVYRRYTDNKVFLEALEFNFVRFEDITGVISK